MTNSRSDEASHSRAEKIHYKYCYCPINRLNSVPLHPASKFQDREVLEIRDWAHKNLPHFFDSVSNPKHSQYFFAALIKDGDSFRWYEVLKVAGPEKFECLQIDGVTHFILDSKALIDWAYVDNFKLVGGASVRLFMPKLMAYALDIGDENTYYEELSDLPFLIKDSNEVLCPDEPFFDAIGNQDLDFILKRVKADPQIATKEQEVAFPNVFCRVSAEQVSPALYAVWLNADRSLRCLIENDKNLKDSLGAELLSESARAGHLNCMRVILDSGLHIDSQNARGYTALFIAAQNTHMDCFQYLLSKGASVNILNNEGYSAVHHVSSPEVLLLLLKNGAQIDPKSHEEGLTPLMYHAFNKEFEICNLLIENGASLDLTDHQGVSAKEYLEERAEKAVFEAMLVKAESYKRQKGTGRGN